MKKIMAWCLSTRCLVKIRSHWKTCARCLHGQNVYISFVRLFTSLQCRLFVVQKCFRYRLDTKKIMTHSLVCAANKLVWLNEVNLLFVFIILFSTIDNTPDWKHADQTRQRERKMLMVSVTGCCWWSCYFCLLLELWWYFPVSKTLIWMLWVIF